MSISKIIGSIEEHRGASGRIKIISFKRDGLQITNPVEIKKEFPPDGFIFAPYFFDHKDLKLNSLIEFPYNVKKSNKNNGDEYIFDFNTECKVAGYSVFSITEDILISNYSINQTVLNNHFEKFDSQFFYIRNNTFLYGPFKQSNNEILPKTGKEVYRWEWNSLSDLICNSGDRFYLFDNPVKSMDSIDCMTSAQLAVWLKDQIRILKLSVDYNFLAKALESQQYVGLEIDRLKRVLSGIDQISVVHSELKYLAESSEKLHLLYTKWLDKAKDELKKEVLNPIIDEKEQLSFDIDELLRTKEKLNKDLATYSDKISVIKGEYDIILENKNRLIDDIKIQTQLGLFQSNTQQRLVTYDEQIYYSRDGQYDNITEFINLFNQSISNRDNVENKFCHNMLYQLKDKRCFLSYFIEPILQIAKMSNNCKVFVQQVEPDWLKFESFFDNGLKQICISAHENSDTIHFLILEDLNMASVECFARPLLDLINGIRLRIPGLNMLIPNNLWLFGIPISENKINELGLPLLKDTFSNWGFLPKELAPKSFNVVTTNKYLSLETIFEHNVIIPISSSEYFSD